MTRVLWVLLACFVAFGCGDKTKKPGSCNTEKDCKAGQHCDNNRCVQCKEDSQCPKGQRCAVGACIAAPECTRNDQCKTGEVCLAGKCRACSADAECGMGSSCEAGVCKKGKSCQKDEDCADDEDCVNGVCKRAGAGGATDANAGCTLATVYFGYDQAGIEPSERPRLEQNYACMEKSKGKTVLVVGHTDTSGTEEYNIALSERRAQSVADFLARLGADPARLQVVPKGETEPSGMGDDKDRRCDFAWR